MPWSSYFWYFFFLRGGVREWSRFIFYTGAFPFGSAEALEFFPLSDSCVPNEIPVHSTGLSLTPTCLLSWIWKETVYWARDKGNGEWPLSFLNSLIISPPSSSLPRMREGRATLLVFSPCSVAVERNPESGPHSAKGGHTRQHSRHQNVMAAYGEPFNATFSHRGFAGWWL